MAEEVKAEDAVKICVLGCGSYGTAMATVAARRGHKVVMYTRKANTCDEINKNRKNPQRFSDHLLHDNISASCDLKEAFKDCKLIIHAIPTQFTADFLEKNKDIIPKDVVYVCTAKGIHLKTRKLCSDLIPDILGRTDNLAYLSGPSFAKEIIAGHPMSVVVAAIDKMTAAYVQRLLNSIHFRIYISIDVVGVEIGGALKNPLAIGAGMAAGLGYGQSTLAGIVTRGAVQMQRLALALGGRPETLNGLSGMGDLMLTCFCSLSRNRTCGYLMSSEGLSAEEAQQRIGETVEGVATAKVILELMEEHNLKMPMFYAVGKILKGEMKPDEALKHIMKEQPKEEGFLSTHQLQKLVDEAEATKKKSDE